MSGLSISVSALPAGDGACSLVTPVGEADLTCSELREALTAEMARKPRLIVVDLSSLTFIDSGALQMIVAAYQVIRHDGGTLALVSPLPPVARVLELTGIGNLLPVYSSIEEAASRLGSTTAQC